MDMSIASASTQWHKLTYSANLVSLLKKTMETQEVQAQQLMEMLPRQAASFGHQLDVYI